MSTRRIAQFLSLNRALDPVDDQQRWFSVPSKNFKVRYQLWQGESDSRELFEVQSRNRSKNGFMGRFML